jgi:hypothetical protein
MAIPAPMRMLYAGPALTARQGKRLMGIARRTFAFFRADTDARTDLPFDHLDMTSRGLRASLLFTTPTDIAMYMWAIVAAAQLHVISDTKAQALAVRELDAVQRLSTWRGFLFSDYSATTGAALVNIGGPALKRPEGQLISTVDNGWYASALDVVGEAFPGLRKRAWRMLRAMDFRRFYDAASPTSSASAGQLYGGWIVGSGATSWEYGNLNTDPRISIYVGLGLGELPGTVWWRTWRTLPASDSWQTQVPRGRWRTFRDPESHGLVTVFEGHYDYRGITYVPSWGGSEFEALMVPLVVPEAAWGLHSFGLNDVNYAEASIVYAHHTLHDPVWGLSPASMPGSSRSYGVYGAYPLGSGGQANAYAQSAVAPYASFLALPLLPEQSVENIDTLLKHFDVYSRYGFYDSVNPHTGVVARRYLSLDQGMILAGIDDVLEQGGLQRYFAASPLAQRVRQYLSVESFSIRPISGLALHVGDPAQA